MSQPLPATPTSLVSSPDNLRIGQKWREVDRRFQSTPAREVIGFTSDDRVLLAPVFGKRPAKCNPKRFNGRSGGYELVQDVADAARDTPAHPLHGEHGHSKHQA